MERGPRGNDWAGAPDMGVRRRGEWRGGARWESGGRAGATGRRTWGLHHSSAAGVAGGGGGGPGGVKRGMERPEGGASQLGSQQMRPGEDRRVAGGGAGRGCGGGLPVGGGAGGVGPGGGGARGGRRDRAVGRGGSGGGERSEQGGGRGGERAPRAWPEGHPVGVYGQVERRETGREGGPARGCGRAWEYGRAVETEVGGVRGG